MAFGGSDPILLELKALDVYAVELQDRGVERPLAAAARRGVHVHVILPAPADPGP